VIVKADYGDGYSRQRSEQSGPSRAELVALRRLGTVEDCAKVVEFLATNLSVTGAVIPIDGGLVRDNWLRGHCSLLESALLDQGRADPIVNVGEKMHQRAGVKLHHGWVPETSRVA
jgi:hypothetical protein